MSIPKLDQDLLLAHVLNCTREYILIHPEHELSKAEKERYQSYLARREAGEPLAYITGKKEFWGLDFKVTPDVLIPRPETELIIELVLDYISPEKTYNILDLGTGSGCIAISLTKELERKKVEHSITAVDISEKALAIAKENAGAHRVNINFLQSDWFGVFQLSADRTQQTALSRQRLADGRQQEAESEKYDIILSNPPYVNPQGEFSESILYEPKGALFAEEQGLKDVFALLEQVSDYLKSDGIFLCEIGAEQKPLIEAAYPDKLKFYKDLAGHDRVLMKSL